MPWSTRIRLEPVRESALAQFVSPDAIRSAFSRTMSEMYRREVPLYGDLIELVAEINGATLARDPFLRRRLVEADELARVDEERHGAIRVGFAAELDGLRRVFAVMGMRPVGYYDLAAAGVPVHSTAFRPVGRENLARSPFRVFTSLLRLELIDDAELRACASEILARRNIFSDRVRELLAAFERAGGLTEAEAEAFVAEVLEIFRWRSMAIVDRETYGRLHDAHRLVADVVSFRGPHINHLTPRTLDIDAAQAAMQGRGLQAKAVIEGPPRRAAPILLRQTSFKAVEEPIGFPGAAGCEPGAHTARFGEIEQRGAALTKAGRRLYDALLNQVREEGDAAGASYAERLEHAFGAFPDDLDILRRQRLAFFRYAVTEAGRAMAGRAAGPDLEGWIEAGWVSVEPILYEDFLPVSAAGIFHSNLGVGKTRVQTAQPLRDAFEAALGAPVLDEMTLYEAEQANSLEDVHRHFDRCSSLVVAPR